MRSMGMSDTQMGGTQLDSSQTGSTEMSCAEMEIVFERQYPVGHLEIDLHSKCRPSSVMMFMQHAATIHSQRLRISRDQLVESRGCFWILSRAKFELNEPLLLDDELALRTWCREAKGVTWNREFEFVKNGKVIGGASTLWVIAELETKKLIKVSSFSNLAELTHPEKHSGVDLLRLKPTSGLKSLGMRRVVYSDCDINQHLNNTRYADILCDMMDMHLERDRFVNSLQINFVDEARPGDLLEVFASDPNEQGIRYACGKFKDGRLCFEAELSMALC